MCFQVCGAPGAPCDALCGGGGCGRCGGESCEGAVTKADTALKMVDEAEKHLVSKESEANTLLSDVSLALEGGFVGSACEGGHFEHCSPM